MDKDFEWDKRDSWDMAVYNGIGSFDGLVELSFFALDIQEDIKQLIESREGSIAKQDLENNEAVDPGTEILLSRVFGYNEHGYWSNVLRSLGKIPRQNLDPQDGSASFYNIWEDLGHFPRATELRDSDDPVPPLMDQENYANFLYMVGELDTFIEEYGTRIKGPLDYRVVEKKKSDIDDELMEEFERKLGVEQSDPEEYSKYATD